MATFSTTAKHTCECNAVFMRGFAAFPKLIIPRSSQHKFCSHFPSVNLRWKYGVTGTVCNTCWLQVCALCTCYSVCVCVSLCLNMSTAGAVWSRAFCCVVTWCCVGDIWPHPSASEHRKRFVLWIRELLLFLVFPPLDNLHRCYYGFVTSKKSHFGRMELSRVL